MFRIGVVLFTHSFPYQKLENVCLIYALNNEVRKEILDMENENLTSSHVCLKTKKIICTACYVTNAQE